MQYRSLILSVFRSSMTQWIGPGHHFATAAVETTSDQDLMGDDLPRKFMARASVALQIGNLLQGALAASEPIQMQRSEEGLQNLARCFITRFESGSFPLCETVAMSLRLVASALAMQLGLTTQAHL